VFLDRFPNKARILGPSIEVLLLSVLEFSVVDRFMAAGRTVGSIWTKKIIYNLRTRNEEMFYSCR